MGPCQTCFDWDFAFVARHLKIQRKIPWYPRISLGESLQETPTSVFRIKHQQLFYSLSQLNPSIKNYSKVRVKKGIFFLDFIMFHHISSQLNGLIGVFHYKPYIYIFLMFHHVSPCFTMFLMFHHGLTHMFHHVSHGFPETPGPYTGPYTGPSVCPAPSSFATSKLSSGCTSCEMFITVVDRTSSGLALKNGDGSKPWYRAVNPKK